MTTVVVFLNCACYERQFSQTCQKTCQKTGSKLQDRLRVENRVDP